MGFPFVDAAEAIVFNDDGSFDAEETNRELSERLESPGPGGDSRLSTGKEGRLGEDIYPEAGSDVTGAIVARAIHADMYENWTDVSGMLVTDPRIVNDPEVIETITYKELRELAYMGATVLHEDAIFPVRKEGIPHQYPQHQPAGG